MLTYPNHNWDTLRWKRSPPQDWKIKWSNGKQQITQELINTFGSSLDAMYKIDSSHFKSDLGTTYSLCDTFQPTFLSICFQSARIWLSEYHGDCAASAVMALFPTHQWTPWNFAISPRGLWLNPRTRRDFIDSITLPSSANLEEFYRLTSKAVIANGGPSIPMALIHPSYILLVLVPNYFD